MVSTDEAWFHPSGSEFTTFQNFIIQFCDPGVISLGPHIAFENVLIINNTPLTKNYHFDHFSLIFILVSSFVFCGIFCKTAINLSILKISD
jgi:hypothetical protein